MHDMTGVSFSMAFRRPTSLTQCAISCLSALPAPGATSPRPEKSVGKFALFPRFF